ncbi:uncharacterized protein LOC144162405 isoform X2 [Haemaphysalis longicornis]
MRASHACKRPCGQVASHGQLLFQRRCEILCCRVQHYFGQTPRYRNLHQTQNGNSFSGQDVRKCVAGILEPSRAVGLDAMWPSHRHRSCKLRHELVLRNGVI